MARTLEVIGERWTALIVRDALLGISRFDDFHASLGVPTNTLTKRLASLVAHGILVRSNGEYALTAAGRDLEPVIRSLLAWGDQYRAPNGPPRLVHHRPCGTELDPLALFCTTCDLTVPARDIELRAGPGSRRSASRR